MKIKIEFNNQTKEKINIANLQKKIQDFLELHLKKNGVPQLKPWYPVNTPLGRTINQNKFGSWQASRTIPQWRDWYRDKFQVELGIHFISPNKIKKINYQFRHINKPTDALSFPIYKNIKPIINEKNINLGDIFICPNIAYKQAKEYKITFNQEITNLSIHGLKHLLGIHHR